MKKKTKTAKPAHDSDFDGPWKAAAKDDLPSLVQKYFPRYHKLIDWNAPVVFEDTELTQILGKPKTRNKFVDLLVKVRFLDGGERWIWLHFEFQTDYRKEFDERTFYHNCGLVYLHKGPVITLVVRGDLAKKWEPSEYVYQCEDFEHRIKFPTCKLSERVAKDWMGDASLPVILARAHLEAVRTASDPEARFAAKRELVRELYGAGYRVAEFRRVFRLVDWMMHLRDDLERHHVRPKKLGRVYSGDVAIITKRDPDSGRGADLAFASHERLKSQPADAAALVIAPELVIEVISPSNSWDHVMEKTGGVPWDRRLRSVDHHAKEPNRSSLPRDGRHLRLFRRGKADHGVPGIS